MIAIPADTPVLRFYRAYAPARPPQRADRSAGGTLPTRAFRYCEAVTSASAFGSYVFAPMAFSLLWDGDDVYWDCAANDGWTRLDSAQFPGFAATFDAAAPPGIAGFAPPFLTAMPEPGVVQIWTGLLARTAPGWSLHVRAPANLPRPGGFVAYEGIVETDRWFGPLFTNIRLTRTDVPVTFDADMPLLQVQPLPRAILAEAAQEAVQAADDLAAFTPEDWRDYRRTIVEPVQQTARPPGAYAVAARKRARCPFGAVKSA